MTDAKRPNPNKTKINLNVHIDSLDNMGARFAAAWHAGETGKPSPATTPQF